MPCGKKKERGKEKIMKKEKEKTNTPIVITAIIAIAIIEICALLKGLNGVLLTTVIGVICLLAGVVMPTPKFLKGG